MIKEKGFKELTAQAGIQTQFNVQIEELKELLAEGILPIFISIGGWLAEHMGIVKTLVGLYAVMKGIILAGNVAKAAGILLTKKQKAEEVKNAGANVVGNSFKMAGGLGPLGIAVVAGLIGAGVGALAMYAANDGVFPAPGGSGHGKRMLLGPEGAIQLNNKDTVIAGTNLFDKADDMVSAPAGAVKVSPSSGGNAEVVNAINNLKQSVAALASRPINVSIDGQKVIKATTGANPNTDGDEMRKNSYKLQ
jgi:hypothetical protein